MAQPAAGVLGWASAILSRSSTVLARINSDHASLPAVLPATRPLDRAETATKTRTAPAQQEPEPGPLLHPALEPAGQDRHVLLGVVDDGRLGMFELVDGSVLVFHRIVRNVFPCPPGDKAPSAVNPYIERPDPIGILPAPKKRRQLRANRGVAGSRVRPSKRTAIVRLSPLEA